MSQRNTVTNPLSGRVIRIGGATYNRLIIEAYDHINGELVRRESAPPLPPRQRYINIFTGRSILVGSRRYNELMQTGWEIEDNHYLVPPIESISDEIMRDLAMIQEAGYEIRRRRETQRRDVPQNPTTYEELMAVHGENLASLNIALCRECFYPLKPAEGKGLEEGEYCDDCLPNKP